MIVFRISKQLTRYDVVQPANSGSKPMGSSVVSNANTAEAMKARDAPPNMAAIPTSAATRTSTCKLGQSATIAPPPASPSAPPIVHNGASVPPDVPLESEIDHETNFNSPSM